MAFFLCGQGLIMAQDAIPSINQTTWGEVVINELMADPYPPVRWEEEYLELYNRSERALDLEGWDLHINTRSHTLSETLMPGGTRVDPGSYGIVTGLTLPNDGALVCLYEPGGILVHAASYKLPWDGEDWKKEGGWSLESPDPEQLCTLSELWEFSEDPEGGTPGRINSRHAILEDMESPVLLYSGFDKPGSTIPGEVEPGLLRLFFSEPLHISSTLFQEIVLQPGNLSPMEANLPGPLCNVLELRFPADLQDRPHFKVKIPVVEDCQGNESRDLEALAGSVKTPVFGSVLINEIMYDPEEGRSEFIELTLPGNGYYDLYDLAIHVEDADDPAQHPVPLSDQSRLIVPGSFLVVSDCVEQLRDSYGLDRSGQWVEAAEMKNLPNGGGTIYLTDRAGNVVDRANYGDQIHAPILSDTRGISLERISLEGIGNDPDNWHSAASLQGFATPGRVNSQALKDAETGQLLKIEPSVFSPDNDGYEDLLEIIITTGVPGWVLNVWITDLEGYRLRTLANNHLCGPTTVYTWDGCREDRSMVPTGFCVIHATAYHPPTGGRWIRKRAVGLVYR